MVFQTKIYSVLAFGVSALSLSGCIGHPNSMPGGYTYHHQEYKSATPAPSYKVTAKQRQYMDVVQAEQFRSSVYDLLSRMTVRSGLPPKPVYVLAPEPLTTFYANIDNDLRESMRAIGYAISDVPVGAYVFTYNAEYLDEVRGVDVSGQSNVELMLKVFDYASPKARQLTQEIGRYYIQGAETLHIQPTHYSDLPSYQQIKNQIDGFESYEPVRTATGGLNTITSSASQQMPLIDAPSQVEPSVPTQYITQPMQGAVVDSSGISYGAPLGDYQPSTPRARISKEMEY
jgi:hypothetical protein